MKNGVERFPLITDIASYNIRSYTVTARTHTRSRTFIGDIGVVVSFPRVGATHFFPAIVEQLMEFDFCGATHRIARIFPYTISDVAIAHQTRMERLYKDKTECTSPVVFAACTTGQRPLIARESKPLLVFVTRIYGLLVTMSMFPPDGDHAAIANVVALTGYFPWYKPGRHGCKRATLKLWDYDVNEEEMCI